MKMLSYRNKILFFLGFGFMAAANVEAAWINEIHYDNVGGDTGEFVEVVLEPGELANDFSLEFYNGNGGGLYASVPTLGGPISTVSGFSLFALFQAGIQNGSPDGLALVQNSVVTQFLSYEGAFMATNGTALGMTSTDIGVSESSSTAIGDSLQLVGIGSFYSDFSWTGPTAESPGQVNAQQTLVPGAAPVPEPITLALFTLALAGLGFTRRRQS